MFFIVKFGEEIWTLAGGPYQTYDEAHGEGARLITGGFAKEVRVLSCTRTMTRGLDPNSYHRPEKPPVIPRHLTSSDLHDIYGTLVKVLQDQGLTPSPPIDLVGQRRLGLQTLLQEARRAAAVLARVVVMVDGKPTSPHAQRAAQLDQVVEAVEKEWRL